MDDEADATSSAAPKRARGALKPVPKPGLIKAGQVVKSKPARTGVTLRKKDFMDRATDRAGGKKAEARVAIDAALAVLAEALAAGDEVILPPLGKLKVTREKSGPRGRILLLRLQLAPEDADGTEPLAAAGD